MGLVKTRRLAAMHPPSPRLRRIGERQGAKAALKPLVKGDSCRITKCSNLRGMSRMVEVMQMVKTIQQRRLK